MIGGVARRATLIKQFRERGPVLLVDAGNWAAGGPYDEESDGDPQRDALRTELMAKAMALMKYDSVALGQVEQSLVEGVWGATRAELIAKAMSNPALGDPGRTRRILELEQALPEPLPSFLAPLDASLQRRRPSCAVLTVDVEILLESGRTMIDCDSFATAGSFRIFLSQVGEERTTALLKGACDLAINAGRKDSTRTSWTSGTTVVANFDYQVQRLGVAEVFRLPEEQKNANG